MKIATCCLLLTAVLLTAGCATAQPADTVPVPVRLDELVALSRQAVGDDAVIAQIEQRGVAFVLAPQDFETQRAAGVSEGVLRYLQGRAVGEQNLKARILTGRYPVAAYYGTAYLGYPYLGYYDGLHYYGGGSYFYGGSRLGGRLGGHIGASHGGHRGGRH